MRAALIGGGNLGDVSKALERALAIVAAEAGAVEAVSGVYRSAPWGFEASEDFLNQVWIIDTPLTAHELLDVTQGIERRLGRTEKSDGTYRSRTMDIDILFYGDAIVDTPRLKIPHPLLHKRDFVLTPLREAAPGWVHPVLGKKVEEL